MTPSERLRAAIEPLLPIDGRTCLFDLVTPDDCPDEARYWLGAIWCELRAVPKGCVGAYLWRVESWQSCETGTSVFAPVVQKTVPLWLREVEAMAELLRRVREREARR